MDLRFHVASAEWLPEDVRHKILQKVRMKEWLKVIGPLMISGDQNNITGLQLIGKYWHFMFEIIQGIAVRKLNVPSCSKIIVKVK